MDTVESMLADLKASKRLDYIGSGKVRELFDIRKPDTSANYDPMASFVTDRWSAREFTFGFPIENIGLIRNAMTIHWKRRLQRAGINTDLLAWGKRVGEHLLLPTVDNRFNQALWKRTTIVKKYKMIKYELIYRFNCVGSVYAASQKGDTEFCGNRIEPYTQFGAEFKAPLCTPTTKAAVGHDLNVDWRLVEEEYPGLLAAGERIAVFIRDTLAAEDRGNLIDIKLEMAQEPDTGDYILCDEISPDSCRFVNRHDYGLLLQGKRDQVRFLDKEYGRTWADKHGIKNYDPENPEHVAIVKEWRADETFLSEFYDRYAESLEISTGYRDVNQYYNDVMGF